jgi:ribosomal protein L7/L12
MNKAELEKFQELVTKNNELIFQLQNTAPQMYDISFEGSKRTLDLALKGGKIHQIKLVRAITGMSLTAAKEYVDNLYA